MQNAACAIVEYAVSSKYRPFSSASGRPPKYSPSCRLRVTKVVHRPRVRILGFLHRQRVALCEPLSLRLCSVYSQVDVCFDPTLFPRCRALAVEGDAVKPRIAASIK